MGKVLNVLCKFPYNAWEVTVTLFFNKKSIQKWRHCSVFLRVFRISFQMFCQLWEKFWMFYASFFIMLEKVLSLYSSIKSLYKNEDIAVFFFRMFRICFWIFANCGKSSECFMQLFTYCLMKKDVISYSLHLFVLYNFCISLFTFAF